MNTIDILDPRAAELARPGEVMERLATGAIWSEASYHFDASA